MRKATLSALTPKCNDLEREITAMEEELEEMKKRHEAMDDVMDALEADNDPDEADMEKIGDVIPNWQTDPVPDYEKGRIETLLAYAPLCGTEIADLEEMLEDDNFDRKRYQEIYNAHLATIHAHDDE
jgi:chromosome segregation ATPase